jgi:hypothetical protein
MGALGGGVLFDAMGSYNRAVQVGVLLGLLAGLLQMAFTFRSELPPGQSRPA